jgi:hypothetical protein
MNPTSMNQTAGRVSDRRRATRRKANAPVNFCADQNMNWESARVLDYSILGVRLRSRAPLTLGQQVVVVPPNAKAAALHGTIRWLRVAPRSIFERILLHLGRWSAANPPAKIPTVILPTTDESAIYEAGVEFPDQITDIRQRLSS